MIDRFHTSIRQRNAWSGNPAAGFTYRGYSRAEWRRAYRFARISANYPQPVPVDHRISIPTPVCLLDHCFNLRRPSDL